MNKMRLLTFAFLLTPFLTKGADLSGILPAASSPAASAAAVFSAPKLSASELQGAFGNGFGSISGVITNPGPTAVLDVTVLLDLLGDQGEKVGETSAYTHRIEPGHTWRFTALVTQVKSLNQFVLKKIKSTPAQN
jgi:hypothetical protein